ncbi:hypothetical protein C807_03773 [Lachnospiraceae bacterium 28-4]|nr:hypothetical protein C807_03773 [Lachnospiraceae bacterium 28-4]
MLPYRDKRDSVPRHICNLFPKCYIIRNLLVIQVLGAGFAFGKFGSRMWGEARKKANSGGASLTLRCLWLTVRCIRYNGNKFFQKRALRTFLKENTIG